MAIKKFMLIKDSKKPQVDSWNKSENYPKYTKAVDAIGGNYGIPTGKLNGVVVCDYDCYKRTDLDINVESLKAIHGDTLIVSTPNGGFHVYNKYEENKHGAWKGLTGLQDGFLDIRTTDNYVVGWESTINDKPYKIVNGSWEGITKMPQEIYKCINGYMTPKRIQIECDCEEYEPILVEKGFTNIRWVNGYDFDCDQKGKGAKCPLCEGEHRSNHFYVVKDDFGCVWVKNHSNKCKRLKLKSPDFSFTLEEEKQMEEEPEVITEEYLIMKRKFETNVCRILEPLVYVVENTDNTFSFLNSSLLRERFLSWTLKNDKGKNVQFIDCWLRDKNNRTYNKLDFLPNEQVEGIFNTWKGFEVEKCEEVGDPQPFLDLFEDLCGGDTKYCLDWIARLFQYPDQKPTTALVFQSPQGCGKNTAWDAVGEMMGNKLYYYSDDVEQDIIARFSTAFENTKLVVVDEADPRQTFKSASKLKSIVSNKIAKVERKGIQRLEIKNLSGVVFLSNDDIPVKIEDSDRRFVCYTSGKKLINDRTFFKHFNDVWVKDRKNLRAVYDLLMARDIKDIDWINDRPVNAIYEEMRQTCLSWDIKWIENLIVYQFPHEWVNNPVKTLDLCFNYNRFTPSSFDDKNEKAFGILLSKLVSQKSMPGLEKIRRNTGMVWNIDRRAIFNWLKEKKYTMEEDLYDPFTFLETEDV